MVRLCENAKRLLSNWWRTWKKLSNVPTFVNRFISSVGFPVNVRSSSETNSHNRGFLWLQQIVWQRWARNSSHLASFFVIFIFIYQSIFLSTECIISFFFFFNSCETNASILSIAWNQINWFALRYAADVVLTRWTVILLAICWSSTYVNVRCILRIEIYQKIVYLFIVEICYNKNNINFFFQQNFFVQHKINASHVTDQWMFSVVLFLINYYFSDWNSVYKFLANESIKS